MNNTSRVSLPRRFNTQSTPLRSSVLTATRDEANRVRLLAALTLAASAACVWPALAQAPAPNAAPTTTTTAPGGTRLSLAVGNPVTVDLPPGASYYVLSGRDNLALSVRNGVLEINPRQIGQARVVIAAPGEPERTYNIRIAEGTGAAPVAAEPVIVEPVPANEPVPAVPEPLPYAVEPLPEYSAPVGEIPTEQNYTPPATNGPVVTVNNVTLPAPSSPNDATTPAPTIDIPATPALMEGTQPVDFRPVAISNLPLPAAGEQYPVMQLTQGMAKLIPSGNNVLAVFFSNDNVMDARAINARTIAITGKAPGQSTLAIFKARNAKDVVGTPEVYTVVVAPPSPRGLNLADQTPETLRSSVTAAINDPRIKTDVFETPGGGLVVRLTGTVRDAAEKQAAERIVELFGAEVASGIVVNESAPTIEQFTSAPMAPAPTPLETLQSQIRSITGNPTLEFIEWPTGLILKGEVNSVTEAEQILGLASGLGRSVMPIIRVRGDGGASETYQSPIPQLSPEDRAMTQRMQAVTGIQTVYAVRTAFNAIAITGSVSTRSEYDRIRRYASLLPQILGAAGGSPAPGVSTTPGQGINVDVASGDKGLSPVEAVGASAGLLPSMAPATGYRFPTQIQMFVRITDPNEATIRQVTVDTSIVEISRTALRHLGVQVGSATLLGRDFQPGNPATVVTNPVTGVTTVTGGTADVVTTEIDPTFREGVAVGGNGFTGSGPKGLIDPLRVRLNALFSNGDARILSNPNMTTLEGAEAQLIVGGQRPITRTTVNEGQVTQDIEFRPFGIILTARPTVGGDDTITLQIRADVTELDFTSAIVIGGAQIPGERTRSVDTTVVMKPGDTLVMGGLIANERRKEYSRVPLLSKIPILGKLFQSKRFVNDETELAIFLTPTLRRIAVGEEELSTLFSHPNLPQLRPVAGIGGGNNQTTPAGTGPVASPNR